MRIFSLHISSLFRIQWGIIEVTLLEDLAIGGFSWSHFPCNVRVFILLAGE